MLPKKGRLVPPDGGGPGPAIRYAEVIALALKTELGDTHRAVKTLRRWTGASERAVKNWLAGTAGPSGDHLLHILRHSDTALEMVLAASRRVQVLELLFGSAEPAAAAARVRTERSETANPHPAAAAHLRSVTLIMALIVTLMMTLNRPSSPMNVSAGS